MPSPIFKVEIKGLDQFKEAFSIAPDVTKSALEQAIKRVPDVLAKFTIAGIVPYRTGQLIQTFRRSTDGLTARWFPTVHYAPFVEFGTGPHVILPKKGKALFWKGAAHPVAKVNHPGSRKNPYMERILARAKPDIDATFGDALDAIIDKLKTRP